MEEQTRTHTAPPIHSLIAAAWQQTPDALRIIDSGGIIREINDAFCRLVKKTRSELIGKPFYTVYAETEKNEHEKRHCDRIASHTADAPAEELYELWNGERRWLSIMHRFVEGEGEPAALFSVFRDVTERKREEASTQREREVRFHAVIDHSTDVVLIIEPDGTIAYETLSASKVLGYEPGFMTGKTPFDFILPEDHETVRRGFERLHANEASGIPIQFRMRRCDGSIGVFESIGTNLIDNPHVRGIVVNTRDITERTALEQQLVQAQKLEGLGTLAGGIAHDFNNLLAMILGSAELLKGHARGNEKILKHVERIIESSERGASISRQLLLFSRPDQVKLEPLSVSHIVLQVEELLRHFFPKDITISTHINLDNGMIMGESGHIHQALLNLAINARDAMPAGGFLRIEVASVTAHEIARLAPHAVAQEYVMMKVSDTGNGMDEATLQKIYNPFFTTKDPGKGTGLGLAIVHGIVKSHNGFIRVESQVGNGSSFSIYIPAIDRKGQSMPESVGYAGTKKETVLIVDDEELVREVLYDALEAAGYTVLAAQDGAEGLRMYNQFNETIALVITDIGMPKMSGSVFIKKLKEIDPAVKVIVTSGYMDATAREQMNELGVDEILSKPYKFSTINAAISKALCSS